MMIVTTQYSLWKMKKDLSYLLTAQDLFFCVGTNFFIWKYMFTLGSQRGAAEE